MKILLLVFLALSHYACGATSTGAAAVKPAVPTPAAIKSEEPLASIDSEIFDASESGEQKYKRALAELDALLGTINQQIEGKKSRTKREAYGWGQEVSSGHGWGGWAPHPPAHSYRVYHHHHAPRYHHGGLTPEFLLKTALVLKGILVLGHVAALG